MPPTKKPATKAPAKKSDPIVQALSLIDEAVEKLEQAMELVDEHTDFSPDGETLISEDVEQARAELFSKYGEKQYTLNRSK